MYHAGEFEDSINVTGWEPNEDVVWLSEFCYPWQGEDSIDYSGGYYICEGKKYKEKTPDPFLEVNGKIVGLAIYHPSETYGAFAAFDSTTILTLNYMDPLFDSVQYNLCILQRFPNLVGVDISIDVRTEMGKLDSIPSNVRLYLGCGYCTNETLKKLSEYKNIRRLWVGCDSMSEEATRSILKLKGLRELSVPNPHYFEKRKWLYLAKLRKITSNKVIFILE